MRITLKDNALDAEYHMCMIKTPDMTKLKKPNASEQRRGEYGPDAENLIGISLSKVTYRIKFS